MRSHGAPAGPFFCSPLSTLGLEGKQRLRELAKDLKTQHPDTAASVLEGLDEMFTITQLGITGQLARCLATTNVIEVTQLGGVPGQRAVDQLQ